MYRNMFDILPSRDVSNGILYYHINFTFFYGILRFYLIQNTYKLMSFLNVEF